MGRTMPTQCEHGNVIDWGDFGPVYTPEPTCLQCDAAPRTVFRLWDLEAAFLAGFAMSAEGFNDEYPHKAEARAEVRVELLRGFDEWLAGRDR